ncbi:MAG TPA: effector-associated domain EAD1-containing protein [Streptosporangiaceae bacterium]
MATQRWDINLPVDVPIRSIIAKLITTPELPFSEKDDSGKTNPHRLLWEEGNRYLSEAETLGGAGVQEGHTLVLAGESRIEEVLIGELARCFSTSERSAALLTRAGYPAGLLPMWDWSTAAEDFWKLVDVEIKNGAMERGLERLVLAALDIYRANPVFADAARQLRNSTPRRGHASAGIGTGPAEPDQITTRKEFGQLLETECLSAGIYINELAKEAGVSHGAVRRWLSGQGLPSTASLHAVLRACAKQDEFQQWKDAVARLRAQPARREARQTSRHSKDPADLLFRLYIPSERLYAAEAGRVLSLFRDWMTKTRGRRFRQESRQTAAGEEFEFYALDASATRPDLAEEFGNFSDFLTLCSVNPLAAADQLAPLGLARGTATGFVSRINTEVRRLHIDLAQEREKRIMAIRHDLEKQIVDGGADPHAVPSHQLQNLIEYFVPGPTASESLALLAMPGAAEVAAPVTLQFNQQFIHAVESQVIQSVQGTVHLGPQARQLLELVAQFGGPERITLEAAVHEIVDPDTSPSRRDAAKHRLKKFAGQLVGIAQDVAVSALEKYLESKGL